MRGQSGNRDLLQFSGALSVRDGRDSTMISTREKQADPCLKAQAHACSPE